MDAYNVFKIAVPDSRVREFLTKNGWENAGKDREMEMDSYRSKKTGGRICVEDISDDFPVTFLIGELSQSEFGRMARVLSPEVRLMEVESSWEGEPTTIVVSMTEAQVKDMFGRRTKMRPL